MNEHTNNWRQLLSTKIDKEKWPLFYGQKVKAGVLKIIIPLHSDAEIQQIIQTFDLIMASEVRNMGIEILLLGVHPSFDIHEVPRFQQFETSKIPHYSFKGGLTISKE
jgi:hypothetical protein